MTVRLTKFAKRAGCAAKHPPGFLLPLLQGLPRITDPNVLVGSATADDAAVYRLSPDSALVFTTDFFTPIVDDPYSFGAVAAANALSDIYAMGARPLTALNIVGFPDPGGPSGLDPRVLADILRGGAEKAREAGIDIVGGHTIKTEEPIYGLAVTGLVHPDAIVSNAGAHPGDHLVLTKPIGVGIVTTAAKLDLDSLGAIDEAIRIMTTLNRASSEAMIATGVSAATDVTGFGLLGHLRNMAAASGVSATVRLGQVPMIAAAVEYAGRGIVPGGTHANWRFMEAWVEYAGHSGSPASDMVGQLLLCDAQTSGGLLIAVAPDRLDRLLEELRDRGVAGVPIGSIEHGPAGQMRVEE